jgi:uncharacterized phiE125 gp8 family phage protein
MNLRDTVTSPLQTITEPFTVAEVQDWLRLPTLSPADTALDYQLEWLIAAAREYAEGQYGRDLCERQQDLTLDCFPGAYGRIELRDPLISVELVQYTDHDGDDTTLTENTDYVVDTSKQPGCIVPAYGTSWPSETLWPSSAVLVRFTSGIADEDLIPRSIRIGMLMLIQHWYSTPGIVVGGGIPKEVPYGIDALLSFGRLERA